MILFLLLLTPCRYLWYSTTFYWFPSFSYNTLLSATGLLPISMALHYIILAHCLYLSYSTTFYRIPAYPYGTLLSSTGFLPILMVLYYILLAHCLSLWYSTIFSSGSTVFNKIQFVYTYEGVRIFTGVILSSPFLFIYYFFCALR